MSCVTVCLKLSVKRKLQHIQLISYMIRYEHQCSIEPQKNPLVYLAMASENWPSQNKLI